MGGKKDQKVTHLFTVKTSVTNASDQNTIQLAINITFYYIDKNVNRRFIKYILEGKLKYYIHVHMQA